MTLLVGSIFHMTRKIVSEMTYNVSMGTLNPTIPYHTLALRIVSLFLRIVSLALRIVSLSLRIVSLSLRIVSLA